MHTPGQLIRRTSLSLAALLLAVSASPALATTVSIAPLNDISNEADGATPLGDGSTSTIIRNPDGVTINVHTNIEPGAYTVWVLVWNDPSRCINAGPPSCLPPPAGGSDVPDSVVFGSGQVVPSSGRGDFAVHLGVGDTNRPITGGLERAGLTNAMGAEIHVVLRSHGPVLADALEAQITTFGGGCEANGCTDLQGAVHAPGAASAETMKLDEIKALLDRVAFRQGINP